MFDFISHLILTAQPKDKLLYEKWLKKVLQFVQTWSKKSLCFAALNNNNVHIYHDSGLKTLWGCCDTDTHEALTSVVLCLFHKTETWSNYKWTAETGHVLNADFFFLDPYLVIAKSHLLASSLLMHDSYQLGRRFMQTPITSSCLVLGHCFPKTGLWWMNISVLHNFLFVQIAARSCLPWRHEQNTNVHKISTGQLDTILYLYMMLMWKQFILWSWSERHDTWCLTAPGFPGWSWTRVLYYRSITLGNGSCCVVNSEILGQCKLSCYKKILKLLNILLVSTIFLFLPYSISCLFLPYSKDFFKRYF